MASQKKLASARSMKAAATGKGTEDHKVDALAASHAGVDYVVDVKTFTWMINYYPTNWNGYRKGRGGCVDAVAKDMFQI
jgi:hypothetical protein